MAKYLDETGLSKAFELIKNWVTTNFLSDVSYNSTSKKIQKTKNGTTSDVVTLATVATSGSYNDLSNKPTIPSGVSPYDSNPAMDGTASPGSSNLFARGDHVHPTDTSRAANTDFVGSGYAGQPGVHGLVPAPSAKTGTEIGKKYFLLDDGYWHSGWMDLYFDTTADEYKLRIRYMKADGTTQTTLWETTIPAVTTTTRGMMRASDKSNLDTLWNSGDYQSDWNQSDSTAADYIKNKPTIPTIPGDFTGTTGTAAGAHGLVPAPATGEDDAVLWGDGDWEELAIATQAFASSVNVELQHGAGSTYDSASIPAATSSLAGVMSASDKGTLDTLAQFWPQNTTWYGTCSTTASTAAKVVTCANFPSDFPKGSIIAILFSTANTAATPTLNVNSTGAKSIHVGNATPNATTNVLKWSANTLIFFMYDGTQYKYLSSVAAGSVSQPRGANTWYGSCSTGATTAAKTATIDNFVLTKGAVVVLQMTTANTKDDAALTLNVNSTGAKTIYSGNAATSSSNALTWMAGAVLTFVYDGTYWRVLDDGFRAVAGPGLALYGDSGGGTGFKAKMLSDTALTNAATAATEVANRVYPVAVDSNGNLAVNVPWTDTETTISAGTGISIGTGNVINHSNSITSGTIGSSDASSGRTISIPYATYDAQGHITAKGTHTHTIGSLQASDVTSGTFNTARIPNLDASKITSGTIDEARLPSSVVGGLQYQGTAASASAISGTSYKKGWYWIASDTFALTSSINVEPGDMIIAKQDKTSTFANDIDVVQTNIETLTTAEVTALWNAA